MNGFSFDRDWGIGLERDTSGRRFRRLADHGIGDGAAPATRNWLVAGRLAKGILEKDNFNIGLSFGFGKILDVMGNYLLSDELTPIRMAELDLTWVLQQLGEPLRTRPGPTGNSGPRWRSCGASA